MDNNLLPLNWGFCNVWNESLEKRISKPLKERNIIWASELGGSMIDRYLKMKGVEQTNPPNARSLRKFEAGNLMEWVVELVLQRAGILINKQEWCSYEYPDCFRVTGRIDFIAGGSPDWNEAENRIHELNLPEFFNRGAEAIIAHFKEKYPNGLTETVLEIKSCSSFMFELYEKKGYNLNHALQTYHYLKALDMREAHLIYISKDDLRMLEFGIFNPTTKIEIEYKSDIKTMTDFVRNGTEPEKEKEIIFNGEWGKFTKNWKVEYSTYLAVLYGYEQPMHYADKIEPIVSSWNRTLTRCIENKKMTDLNLEVLKEIKKSFPDFDKIMEAIKNEH